MCTVISGDCGCGGSSSSGVTAEGFLATGAILTAVAIGGWVFQRAWVLILVALAIGWICVFPRARRAAFITSALLLAGMLGLVRLARRRRTRPARTVALPQAYTATLYVAGPGGQRTELRSGPVPGVWNNPGDVEAEIIQRWVAVHGPVRGELVCRAQPAGGAR